MGVLASQGVIHVLDQSDILMPDAVLISSRFRKAQSAYEAPPPMYVSLCHSSRYTDILAVLDSYSCNTSNSPTERSIVLLLSIGTSLPGRCRTVDRTPKENLTCFICESRASDNVSYRRFLVNLLSSHRKCIVYEYQLILSVLHWM